MIVVNGIVRTTEEDINALQRAISVMENASREEAGCLDYTLALS